MKKSLCLVLLLGLSMPGCSMFDKNARQQRAYSKYVKKSKAAARERQRSQIIRQRAQIPSLRTPPPPQENVAISEGQ
jgi:hypothetical protein